MQEIILTSGRKKKKTINLIANVTLWLTPPGSIAGLLAPFREMRQRYLTSLHFGGAEDRLNGQKRRSLKTSLQNCRICELLVPKIDDFIS